MSGTGAGLPHDPATVGAGFAEDKGKGKSTAEFHNDAAMDENDDDEDEDDSDDEEEDEDEDFDAENGGDDDNELGKIDLNNIVEGGRRTRGAKIDFAKAAEEHPAEEGDEEDDEEFEPAREDTEMSG